ncbi:glycosyltransferase family 4 protein [Catalinimonas niigatensis]|uniref:glycosyltransferase family 4 protein n=1 Tax=Catalinimonas niigatensis TaxID=1397264 RepID=UPI0026662B31|nr:glycosyltransferase family 4 protein [Catalinimonas niigatensis]WPP51645.1 glycosyltransferase family 4 protein [Catalinimonas niigatensis]
MDASQPLSQTIHFVLPDDRHLPSGGNIYNEQLIEALISLGQSVKIIDFAAYREAVLHDQEGIYGVDSLFVEEMKPLIGVRPAKTYSFFIMHHLQSLHPPAGVDATLFFEEHEKEVLDFFQAFLLSSAYSKTYLLQKGISAPMMVVEPASTLASSVSSLPPDLPVKGLMVANVVERKGILPFLEALSSQSEKEDAFVLNIIGRTDMEPDYFDACVQLVETSDLKNKVHFLGGLEHTATLKQYAQHHLFLSTAHMETFGMAIQEAKVQGLPLLLYEGGHAAKHLEDGVGMLYLQISELAENFIKLSRNNLEILELWQSAKADTKIYEAYTWKQAAALFLNFFRDFL